MQVFTKTAPIPAEVNELLSGFSSGNFEEAVERMKDRERVRVLSAYLKTILPHVHNVIVDER